MLRLTIVGHLGKEAQINNANGKNVINFSVAHTNKIKNQQTGEVTSFTTWVECSYWTDKTAIVPYLKKGTHVLVEGTPSASGYMSGNGEAKASLRLRVTNIQLLGGNNQESQQNQPIQQSMPQHPAGFEPVNNVENPADELPF